MKKQIVSRWDSAKVLFECELPEGLGESNRRAAERKAKRDATESATTGNAA
jgi:hypothetical protein